MQWASTYFVNVCGIEPNSAAEFASLFYIGITAGRFISGFITDRLGDKRTIFIGTVILFCGIGLLFIPSVPYTVAVAGFVIIGLGCAPIFPCLIHSTPAKFGKENSGSIIGIQMASAYVGATFMPLLFGVLGNALGFNSLPVFLAFFMAVMIISAMASFRPVKEKYFLPK